MTKFEENTRTIKIPTNQNVKATAIFEVITTTPLNSATYDLPLSVQINPGVTPRQTKIITYPFIVSSNKILINFKDAIINAASEFLSDIYADYIDEDRELKTLLNYGEDNQTVIINQRYGPFDASSVNTVQLKLLKPLPDEIQLGKRVLISREVASSVVDTVKIRYAPAIDNTPYLRPKNSSVNLNNKLGASLTNVTLNVLGLNSGSLGGYTNSNNISFEDQIMREWYSFDFNSSELNIDFSDYSNFVFYGSAMMRLASFQEKLNKINYLTQQSQQFAGSVFTGSLATAGASYILEQSAKFASEKETIIRSFDRYEQYLYFTPSGSISEYSASAYYADNGVEYNPIGYWPKDVNGNLFAPYTNEAQNWYATQSLIAQQYDEFNENNLVNTIPTHIREDNNSAAFITFIAMVGHFFDTIKPYIDQFPNIYSRQLDPDKELSKDLMVEIAESVGFKLPTLNSLYNLSNNVLGTTLETPRRDYTVETYKRLLHNLPYFVKTKGTRTALNALFRSFGISEELINIKEIGKSVTSSLYVFDEYTNGLEFTGDSSYIKLPLSQSLRSPFPRSVQFNVSTVNQSDMTLLRGDNKWALQIKKHPTISELGRFELTSGSTTLLTSSYQTIFDDELLNVTIRTDTSSLSANLFVIQTNDDDIIFSSSMAEPSASTNTFVPLWNTTDYIYIAGTGSLVTNTFEGTIDEVRMWGINLSDKMVINTAFDPGSNAGEDYTDAADYLYAQLSFNIIDTGSLTSSLANESPYKDISVSPSLEYIDAVNINTGSFVRYSRTVRQILPEIGSSGYVTKKIKVVSNPVFLTEQTGGIKTLSRTESIVPIAQKKRNIQLGRNKISISTSPTEIINQNIIRNIGLENINAAMGSPTELYKALDTDLKSLQEYYAQYYYVDVDINKYIRILSAVSSVLNEVIDYFIPSKATIYTGIVIEPNLLEKIKINPLKQLRFYGANSRKTMNAAASLTGSRPDYDATFNLTKTLDTRDNILPFGAYKVYQTQTEDWKNSELISQSIKPSRIAFVPMQKITDGVVETYYSEVDASTLKIESDIKLYDLQNLDWVEYRNISNSYVQGTTEYVSRSFQPWPKARLDLGTKNLNKIKFNSKNNGSDGADPYNRIYTRKLYDYEISSSRQAGVTSIYNTALYEIPPSCDFKDLGTVTYFNSPVGIYYFPVIKKVPVSRIDLRSPWNFETQQFENQVNWTYGTRYRQGRVVYQNVTKEDIDTFYSLNNLSIKSITYDNVESGNGKYYVFKNDPAYKNPESGEAWYSGSIPSNIPPSLDTENWQRIYFSPVVSLDPKRIIFASGPGFDVPDPILNNFLTTTISVDKIINVSDRYVDTIPIGNIAGLSTVQGEVGIQNISVLFALQSSNSNLRIRFYRTKTARDNDITRTITTPPADGSGVLLDVTVSTANAVELINPIHALIADSTPPAGKLFYTIDNLDSLSKIDITILLYYFAIEIELRVPLGYLKKHYRFFRDNATSTKRRNYEGCKNTDETTIDGLPVVQIFLTEGTKVTVAQRKVPIDSVKLGGGGKLDVAGPTSG